MLDLAFVPRRVNRTELLLLLDCGGSMVPFHGLSHRLAETALQGSRLAKLQIYYFHNCPTGCLFYQPSLVKGEPIDNVLNCIRSQYTGVLIFSDAGAARGSYNQERIELTRDFLNQLRQQVRYITWLNPIPRHRWSGTSAGKIEHLLPMFEFNRQGLDQAISVLRGQPIHHPI